MCGVKVKRSLDQLLVLGGFLMVLDTLLAWQSVTVGGLTFTRNAWHGVGGVLVGLLSVAFLANAVVLAGIVELRLRLPHRVLGISLAAALLVLAVLKNIADAHSGWASYAGIVLAGLLTWGAWRRLQEQPAPEAEEPDGEASPPAPAREP